MRIGFIGTGNMGKPMASHLLAAGYELTVYDKRKEATEELVKQGASWADTPKAVAQASEVTITSLPGPLEVEEITLGANGIFEGAKKGHFYIDMSTNAPSSIRKVATIAATKGIEVLDAPVTGGVRGAKKATLTIMVGANNRHAFEFCEPILKQMGERVILMGEVGSGCVAKLVNNMMSISNLMVAMEAMVLGTKAGVDVQKLFEVVDSGSGSSAMFKAAFPYGIFKGRFEPPVFTLSLAAKDLRLGVDYARDLNIPLRLAQDTSSLLNVLIGQGLGEKDVSAYITLMEKATGVEVRA